MAKSKGHGDGKRKPRPAPEAITDPRFQNTQTDPRFQLPSKKRHRVTIDKRFSQSLKDEDFASKTSVDRYGRRLNTGKKRRIEELYDLEDEGEEKKSDAESDDVSGSEIDDDEVLQELEAVAKKYDPARDGGFSESSSDEDEDEDDEEDQEVDAQEEIFGFADNRNNDVKTISIDDATNRLAVVNLDWDNMRAVDLMAAFSSFCPLGRVLEVSVYPSEFGKERMEREHLEGPPKQIFEGLEREVEEEPSEEDSDEEDADERIRKALLKEDQGEEFNSAKLRRYQLERLRYYYAVLTLSNREAAKALYEATDGAEYLTTANFLDLRFIPDDLDFSNDTPRDTCKSIPDGFKPTNFMTDVLQHSKVKLTWDAGDNVRKDRIGKAFSGSRQAIEENDLKAYLGNSSSDSSDDEEVQLNGTNPKASKAQDRESERQRLRAALGLSNEASVSKPSISKEAVGDMQVTFVPGLSDKDGKQSVFEDGATKPETTAEKYVRKEKERKQRRKEKAKAKRDGVDPAQDDNASDVENPEEAPEEDLGFDDPFFAEGGDSKTKPTKAQRKADRLARRIAEEKEREKKDAERGELERIMNDGGSETIAATEHFNINDVLKAEKAKGKKGKRKSKNALQTSGELQDGFEMNVDDPRFGALFDSHEYAIDPTSSKFKGTGGMRKLLEVAREKRSGGGDGGEDEGRRAKKKKKFKR